MKCVYCKKEEADLECWIGLSYGSDKVYFCKKDYSLNNHPPLHVMYLEGRWYASHSSDPLVVITDYER